MATANEPNHTLAIKRDECDKDMFRFIAVQPARTDLARPYANEWITVMVDGLSDLFDDEAVSVLSGMKAGEARAIRLSIEIGDTVAIPKAN